MSEPINVRTQKISLAYSSAVPRIASDHAEFSEFSTSVVNVFLFCVVFSSKMAVFSSFVVAFPPETAYLFAVECDRDERFAFFVYVKAKIPLVVSIVVNYIDLRKIGIL